jgi:hypothetical protein
MDAWYQKLLMLPTPQKGCSVLSAPVFYTDDGALHAVILLYYCPDVAQNMILRKAFICKSMDAHEKYVTEYAEDPEFFINKYMLEPLHAGKRDTEAQELFVRIKERIKTIVSAPPPTSHRGSFIQRSRRKH